MAPFGLTDLQLRRVLEAACHAPSLHNSQPWAFRTSPDRIELHIDPDRLLPVSDPDRRETRIGCGAALLNLRLALIKYGIAPAVTILPNGETGPLAVIEQHGNTVPSPELAELEQAIPHRRTNRKPFFAADVPRGHQHLLTQAAEAEHGILHLITDPADLGRVQQLAAAAHRIQLADPAWVAEWNSWTRRVGTNDGVPINAAGPAPAPQDQWTLRDFGTPDRPERVDGKDFEDRPLIAVLATHADTPVNQVRAGQAMQRVLLAATVLGMSASYLSQLIEIRPITTQLRTLTGGYSHPQAVIRIGFGNPTPATPRRPVEQCTLTPDNHQNDETFIGDVS
jgi:nitroreductase